MGIHQDLRGVKAIALLGVIGPIDSESVFQIFEVKPEDDHAEDVTDPVMTGKGKLGKRLWCTLVKQHQGAAFSS